HHNLHASDYTDDKHSRAASTALNESQIPDVDHLHKDLERGALERYPEIAAAREDLLKAGARFVRLSGSEPTLFAPFAELASAFQVQQQLQAQGYEVYLSRAISPNAGSVCFF